MPDYSYTSLLSLQRRNQQWYSLLAIALILLVCAASFRDRDALAGLPTFNTLTSLRSCRSDELGVGTWVPEPADAHSWPRLKASAGYTCHDNRHMLLCFAADPSQLPRLASANSWRWQPSGCRLRPFDSTALIRRLARNTRQGKKGSGILFVGDSLALQHSQSFECMMGKDIEQGFLTDNEIGNFTLKDGAGEVDFVRTDYLVQPDSWKLIMPDEEEPADISSHARKWTHMVKDKEFVVLNTGAHWAGDHTPQTLARYERMTHDVVALIDRYPRTTLIVRSAVPGHTNCSHHTAPLTHEEPEMYNSYNWQGFERYNDIWRKTLEQHPKHLFLDIGATKLRPDGHREPDKDCLHYCLPGPPDWWTRLLYHVIMGL